MIFLLIFLILFVIKKYFYTEGFVLNSVNDLINSIKPENGKQGPKGPLGDVGPSGKVGRKGTTPYDLKSGPDGWMGPKGFRGDTVTGRQGPIGERGAMGELILPNGFKEKEDSIVFNNYQICLGKKCYTEDDFKIIQGNENTLLLRNPSCDKCVTNINGTIGEIPNLQKCNKTQKGQNWVYDPRTFLLKNKDHNKCLSTNLTGDVKANVNSGSINYGTDDQNVSLEYCSLNNKKQHWVYKPSDLQLKHRWAHNSVTKKFGLCLNANNLGNYEKLKISNCDPDNVTQNWEKIETNPTYYNIKLNDNSGCIDAADKNKLGGKIRMWDCDKDNKDQQWKYNKDLNQIKNLTGICIDSPKRTTPKSKVHMWECDINNKNQQWNFDVKNNQIKNLTGLCLESLDPDRYASDIIMNKCDVKKRGQQWKLV